jgi:NADH dehydrogenase
MNPVTVFGGTGFLGRRIVKRLSVEGVTVRIAVRHPERAVIDAGHGEGPIVPMTADVRNEGAVAAAIAGADSVVNAVSAYVEGRGVSYRAVHEHGASNVATACQRHGVGQLVHISGIGADPASSSPYIKARGRGELAVQQAFPRAVILRPSVMFAPDDAFLNVLAEIVRSTPVIPLIGGGWTRLQPVHVRDVAEAVQRSLQNPASDGKIYELGGPESYTLREIMEMVVVHMGRRRLFISIPFGLAHSLAQLFEFLPATPLTVAQVDLLKDDNIPAPDMPGLGDLGVSPRRLKDTIAKLATT